MARGDKLLERMRANPRDWRIGDVGTLCSAFALDFDSPAGGSHYGVSDPTQERHITIPFARPIKSVNFGATILLDTAARLVDRDWNRELRGARRPS
jgi:hypothetical protein